MTNKDITSRVAKLFQNSTTITLPKREIFIPAGKTPPGVFYLKEGYVKMNSSLPDGREITSNIFKPGSYFPMLWAISNIPNSFYFQTITPVVMQKISQAAFINFLHQNSDVLFDFTTRIIVGVNGLMFNINYILSGDSYHRVAAAILMLAKRFGEHTTGNKFVISLPLTHQDIADIAAITRETASINVKLMENSGLIAQGPYLTINDLHKLETEVGIIEPSENTSSDSEL